MKMMGMRLFRIQYILITRTKIVLLPGAKKQDTCCFFPSYNVNEELATKLILFKGLFINSNYELLHLTTKHE